MIAPGQLSQALAVLYLWVVDGVQTLPDLVKRLPAGKAATLIREKPGERAGDGRLGVAADLLAQLVRSGSDRRQLHRNKTEVDAPALRPGFSGRRLRHEHDSIREMVERQRGDRAGDKADTDSREGLPAERPRDALAPTRWRRGLGRLELPPVIVQGG